MPAIANHMLQEMAVQVSNELVKQEFLMPQTPALPRGGLVLRCWRTNQCGVNQPQPSSVSELSIVQQNYQDFSRLSLDSPKRAGKGNVYGEFGEVMGGDTTHLHLQKLNFVKFSLPCLTSWHKENWGSWRARMCVSDFRKRKWMIEVQTWRFPWAHKLLESGLGQCGPPLVTVVCIFTWKSGLLAHSPQNTALQ